MNTGASDLRAFRDRIRRTCGRCGQRTLPDPTLDTLTLATCDVCKARYIRKHFTVRHGHPEPDWVRLKWWQRP
jgi:hypothetical protein